MISELFEQVRIVTVGAVVCVGIVMAMTGVGSAQTTQPAMATRPAAGQPVIAVDVAEHDFGQVWAGEKLEHIFKISNTGTAELQITSVRPHCGCTIAGSYPKSLAPGASGEFPFLLSTAKMNGPFNKAILIHSNDPARPVLTLSLKGQARPQIAVEPPGAFFGSVYGEQGRTQVLSLTNKSRPRRRSATASRPSPRP